MNYDKDTPIDRLWKQSHPAVLYAEHTLPDASRLREIINAFFVELA